MFGPQVSGKCECINSRLLKTNLFAKTQQAQWLQSLKSILEPSVRPSPERVVLSVSLSTSIFHPSIINPPRTPPADLVGSPVFVRWAPTVCVCVAALWFLSLWAAAILNYSSLLLLRSHTRTSPSHACPHPPAREAVAVATLSKIADFSSRNEIKGEIGCISIRGGSVELNTHPWSRLPTPSRLLPLSSSSSYPRSLSRPSDRSFSFYIYIFNSEPPHARPSFIPPWLGGRKNETKEEIDLVWMTFDPFEVSKQYAVTWETGHGMSGATGWQAVWFPVEQGALSWILRGFILADSVWSVETLLFWFEFDL